MFCIGEVSEEKKKLVDVTKECIEIGLKHVKPWALLGDMGHAIHEHALENGYKMDAGKTYYSGWSYIKMIK